MAIPTTRTNKKATITINTDRCIGCGKCIEVCSDFSLILENKKAKVNDNPIFGCIACGHCMAICPQDAITVNGRTLSPDDLFDLPSIESAANYEQLLALYQRRRSIREFTDKTIEPKIIEKIVEAVKTSPMGLPPSDVNVLVFDSKEKNRKFAEDFCNYLEGMRWLVSNWFLMLMHPFWGKTNDEVFRLFVKPAINVFVNKMKNGVNVVTYDAPLMMYFYGSPYADPADPIVAATAAMYAAESLGLGTCMLGAIHPLIQNGSRAKKIRRKYGIKYTSREGLFVIFGYPKMIYKKGIGRSLASITFNE